jgi:mono/diheme cytochrome c family protein
LPVRAGANRLGPMKNANSGSSLRLAAAAALVLSVALLSCAGKQTPRDRITDPGEMIYNGLTVSGVDCYKCHNADGTGTWRGANLAERVPKLTDPAIEKAINEGPGMMPAFKGKLDAQQMAAITTWLRGRFH